MMPETRFSYYFLAIWVLRKAPGRAHFGRAHFSKLESNAFGNDRVRFLLEGRAPKTEVSVLLRVILVFDDPQ